MVLVTLAYNSHHYERTSAAVILFDAMKPVFSLKLVHLQFFLARRFHFGPSCAGNGCQLGLCRCGHSPLFGLGGDLRHGFAFGSLVAGTVAGGTEDMVQHLFQ
jgi:hypothetical protein